MNDLGWKCGAQGVQHGQHIDDFLSDRTTQGESASGPAVFWAIRFNRLVT
jgi:hypothetical protein